MNGANYQFAPFCYMPTVFSRPYRHFLQAIADPNRAIRWLVVGLLLIFFGRLVSTEAVKSVTFDEPPHVLHGMQYWQPRPMHATINNPPLIHALIGLLIQVVGLDYHMAYDDPMWNIGDGFDIAQVVLWQANPNGLQLVWVGRLTVMFLALALGCLVYGWSSQLFKSKRAGLLALTLYTFDPNILALGHLATTDLGSALFVTVAAYVAWGYWRQPNWKGLLGTAVGVGAAVGAKFSGLVIVPALLLMVSYRWLQGATPFHKEKVLALGKTAVSLVAILLISSLVLLAIYRFEISLLQADFAFQRDHFSEGHPAYLLGELREDGWWYYFPVVFGVKTPLGVWWLLLLGLGLFIVQRQYDWERLWLLLVAMGTLGAAINGRVNIGYRYLLPMLPLLYVFLGQLAQPGSLRFFKLVQSPRLNQFLAWSIVMALAATLATSVMIHPHYLAYFNLLAGGPDGGWRVAADSNIDWGQDIQALGTYLAEEESENPYISWMGNVPLSIYGVKGSPFLTWPPTQTVPLYDDFYPWKPAPGVYVISVSQLVGIYLDDPQKMTWFRQRNPDDKINYSLFVYKVVADGRPNTVALSGISLGTLALSDFEAAFASNDVRPVWFDARTSFLWPGGSTSGEQVMAWLAVGDGHLPIHRALQAFYPDAGPVLQGHGELEGDSLHYNLFPIGENRPTEGWKETAVITDFGWSLKPFVGADEWFQERQPLSGAAVFGEVLELKGIQPLWTAVPHPGQSLELLSYWQVKRPLASQLKLFIHLLDGHGGLVTQHDGLDVLAKNLQPGDEIVQLHTLVLPPDLPVGTYALQVGVYEAESGYRLVIPVGSERVDHLLLDTFQVIMP